MSDATATSEAWGGPVPFTDEEALARLIEYAREEAVRTGEIVCADLLGAALSTLDRFSGVRGDNLRVQPSALGLF